MCIVVSTPSHLSKALQTVFAPMLQNNNQFSTDYYYYYCYKISFEK